jgi:long-chain fatty acid transport protein
MLSDKKKLIFYKKYLLNVLSKLGTLDWGKSIRAIMHQWHWGGMMQVKAKKPAPWRGVVRGKTGLKNLAIIRILDNWRTGFKIRHRFCYINSLVFITAAILSCTSPALGAGFALLQQGTAAMGQGNAFVADASDASAIFYNPAGLNQLKSAQVYQGVFFNAPDREFQGEGPLSETNHRIYRGLSAYFAIPVHSRVTLGIGYFSPFGMGTAWPPPWEGRYITTFSSLKTYNLNPVISVKVLENLSLAAGFNVMWSKVVLKKKAPVVAFNQQFPDAELRLTGEGQGYGYNLGALFEPVSGVKLGVSYRSSVFIKYQGDLSLNLQPPLAGLSRMSTGSANLTFPPSVTMGINYSRLKPLALEFDVTWTGWSSYDEFRARLDTAVAGSNRVVVPKNWNDAWAFRFGANYEIKEGMKIRAGYIYDLTPVPDGTFDPQVPDANRHIFTVGGDLKVWRFTLGIAYNYILAESRTKNNIITTNGVPVPLQANGRYNSDTHSLGLSWQFQF